MISLRESASDAFEEALRRGSVQALYLGGPDPISRRRVEVWAGKAGWNLFQDSFGAGFRARPTFRGP